MRCDNMRCRPATFTDSAFDSTWKDIQKFKPSTESTKIKNNAVVTIMTEYFPSDLNMTDPYFESAKNLLFE